MLPAFFTAWKEAHVRPKAHVSANSGPGLGRAPEDGSVLSGGQNADVESQKEMRRRMIFSMYCDQLGFKAVCM